MNDNTQTLEQPTKVSMAVPPHIVLGGLAIVGLAIHFLVLPWPEFPMFQSAAAAVILFLSGSLVAWAQRTYQEAGVPFRPFDTVLPLLTAGPYRFSRNPVYIGMAGLLGGMAVLFGSYVFLAAMVVFLVSMHYGYVVFTEARSAADHGEAWRLYTVRVHQWL